MRLEDTTRPTRLRLLLPLLLLLGWGASAAADEPRRRDDSVVGLLERVLPADQLCHVRFLQHLGWRFERHPRVCRLTVHGGLPCRHATLAASRAAGDLRILVPPSFGEADAQAFGRRAAALADGVSSRAAYQLRYAAATRKAVARLTRLEEKGLVQFPELFGVVHSPYFMMAMPIDEWEERGELWVATRSAREALEAVYRRGAKADCYVGQTLAFYGIQYELYGPKAFDEAFAASEISVGRPGDYVQTPIGRNIREDLPHEWIALLVHKSERYLDPVGVLARHGPTSFVGLTGCVCNTDPDEFTVDNLMFLRVSENAVREMLCGGGLAYPTHAMRRVWAEANSVSDIFASPEARDAAEQRVDALLKAPVFSEIDLYVQPDGVITLGDLVRKWMKRTDSPLRLRLYGHGLEDFFFKRYREAFLKRCRGELAGAVAQPAAYRR